ncbi:MAG TPA: GDSL-type esterase/lipase family protein [Elusimicrobiales bacterium]|nr:GDSL-type esterase/lipase family protein [Elusimicrobiales bacterium]
MNPADPIPARPGSQAARKLAVFLLGLLCAALAAEAALRLAGVLFSYAQERRNSIALGKTGYRIMCLGESMTAGSGDLWPAKLENLLAASYPAAGISVINKGVMGADSTRVRQDLAANLDEVRPDLVILMIGINDGFIRYYEGIRAQESPLFKHFRLYRWISIALNLNKAAALRPLPGPAPLISQVKLPDPYLLAQQQYPDAAKLEAALQRRLDRNPADAAALYLQGTHWARQGAGSQRPELEARGEKLLLQAARLAPGNSFIFSSLARIAAGLEDKIRLMEKAAALNPSAENWLYLAEFYRDAGLTGKAEAAYLKAIDFRDLNGEHRMAVSELTWLYLKEKRYSEAETLLQKVRAHNPHDEKISGALASLYRESGRPELARPYAEQLAAARGLYTETTRSNFEEIRRLLKARGVRLAMMQYPMCSLAQLQAQFDGADDVIFIDNERTFQKAVAEKGYVYYFMDLFAGNFGHCTPRGNELIAANAAAALSGYFKPEK